MLELLSFVNLGRAMSNCASRRKRLTGGRSLPRTHRFSVETKLLGWFGRLELGEQRRVFLLGLRAAMLYLSGALAVLFFVTSPAYAQVIQVPPFIGTHSETWERF